MNTPAFNWEDILSLAASYRMPLEKKRAILREFLQCQWLDFLYQQKESQNLHFIGGTSLRILRGLDRFSEDLDFDNTGLSTLELKKLLAGTAHEFERMGFRPEYTFRGIKINTWRADLKFGGSALKTIGVSAHEDEKLSIQFNATKPLVPIEREIVLLNRFGVTEQIITNTLPTLLSQKTLAALERRTVKARDFYDIAWLLSRGVAPSLPTLQHQNIDTLADFKHRLQKRFLEISPDLKRLKSQLEPFLIDQKKVSFLDYFDQIIGQMEE